MSGPALPDGAWDCHSHVFGEPTRFPPRVPSVYALPETPYEVHAEMLRANGLAGAVIVQPAPYAQDMSAMTDALAQSQGRLRGVGSGAAGADQSELELLDAAGVRAMRFLEARTPTGDRYPGSAGIEDMEALAPQMAALGWHAEIWAGLDDILTLWPRISRLGLPVVLDHMAGFDPQRGPSDPAFQRLLGLVRDGEASVKLTLCRRLPFGADLAALRPFHDALVEANPARMLWGSDWPFVRMGEHAPTVPALLDLFTAWVDDPDLQRQILVDNPAARYGRA